MDQEIVSEINNCDKLLKKIGKISIDKDFHNAERFKARIMIFNKKRAFFEEKLTDAREKFKYLWKKLKSIGLLSKNSSKEVSALRVNNTALSEFPLKILPKALNKFFVSSVVKYYEHMIQGDHFNLTFVSENSNLSNFKVTEDSKVAGLLRISGRLLRYGAKFLA